MPLQGVQGEIGHRPGLGTLEGSKRVVVEAFRSGATSARMLCGEGMLGKLREDSGRYLGRIMKEARGGRKEESLGMDTAFQPEASPKGLGDVPGIRTH